MHLLPLDQQPYFHACNRHGTTTTRGLHSCSLGHRIERRLGQAAEGIFAEWLWDGTQLTIRNDRYGFYPLYYSYHEGEISVSPSIVKLVMEGAPTELDFEALSVFLRLGFFLGEDTPFKKICALPPSATIIWRDGQLTVSSQKPHSQPQQLTREQAIEGYVELFRQAVGRMLPPEGEDFVVPLSGGRDSRHILLELCRQGRRPLFCLTSAKYPPTSAEDIAIAARVTSALGLKHSLVHPWASRFTAEWEKNWTTNLCTEEHAWYAASTKFLQGTVGVAFDGIAGDVLSESSFLKPYRLKLFESGNLDELSRKLLLRNHSEKSLRSTLVKNVYREMSRERARSRLTAELKSHASAPNPVGSFIFWNRTRRAMALSPFAMLNAAVPRVYCPFLDHELYDFLSSLPAESIIDRTLHTQTILRAYPQYADLPFEDRSAPKRNAREHQSQFNKELAYQLLKRFRGPSRLMKNDFLLTRLLRLLIDKRYRESIWPTPKLMLYLFQLEKLTRRSAP